MTLVLSESDIEAVLTMPDCLRVLEETFGDFGRGEAVSRPRTHTYTNVGEGTFYNFKSMDGAVPRYGVHALRLSSEVVQETSAFGSVREEKLALAGGRYVGLIMLFDIATTAPLAIMQDAGIQRMRVGATSALAAKYVARADATRVGMFGTGWQAWPQLEALQHVRDISGVNVFSLDRQRRERFAQEMSARLPFRVVAVDSAREAVRGADIIVCATNSQKAVFDGAWLEAGQHVNSLQAGELDAAMHDRAHSIVIRAFEKSMHYVQSAAQELPIHTKVTHRFNEGFEEKLVDLGSIIAGQNVGRRDAGEITLFGGSGTGPSSGLGIQFAAVGKLVYDAAHARGLGHQIPTDWFTEIHHP